MWVTIFSHANSNVEDTVEILILTGAERKSLRWTETQGFKSQPSGLNSWLSATTLCLTLSSGHSRETTDRVQAKKVSLTLCFLTLKMMGLLFLYFKGYFYGLSTTAEQIDLWHDICVCLLNHAPEFQRAYGRPMRWIPMSSPVVLH